MLTVIAEGSTSVCVMSRKDGHVYLKKSLKPQFKDDASMRSVIRKEFEIGQSLSSPYFVKYHEFVEEGGVPTLLMDFVDGGTVKDLLATKESWLAVKENLRKFFVQLLEGLKHLHQQQVVHLDLSPTNIMLTNINRDVRIIDLGFCYSASHLSVIGTTQNYSAPELYDKEMRIDARADIYSVGRIVLEIIDALYPDSADEVSDIQEVAQKCCQHNRSDRYRSAEDAISAITGSKLQPDKRKGMVWLFVAVAVVAALIVWQLARSGGGSDGVAVTADSGVVATQEPPVAPTLTDSTTTLTDSTATPTDGAAVVAQPPSSADTIQSSARPEAVTTKSHRRVYPFTTISDPNYSLDAYVSPTNNKSQIPLTITMKNKLDIQTYQLDVILPNEECVLVRQPGSSFLKSEQYRLPNPDAAMLGYFYDENENSYIISQSIGSIEGGFLGTSGKVLTMYFDGSNLADGLHQVIIHTGILNHIVDPSTVEHFVSNQKKISFVISNGKVTPSR